MDTDAEIKLWLSGRRGSTAQPDGHARDLKLAFRATTYLKRRENPSLHADPRFKSSHPLVCGISISQPLVMCFGRPESIQGSKTVTVQASGLRAPPADEEACSQT